MFLVDYGSLFAPTQAELLAAIRQLAPIALGVFAVIIGIRFGIMLLDTFLDDGADEDDEAA